MPKGLKPEKGRHRPLSFPSETNKKAEHLWHVVPGPGRKGEEISP